MQKWCFVLKLFWPTHTVLKYQHYIYPRNGKTAFSNLCRKSDTYVKIFVKSNLSPLKAIHSDAYAKLILYTISIMFGFLTIHFRKRKCFKMRSFWIYKTREIVALQKFVKFLVKSNLHRGDTILCLRRAPANKRKLGQSPMHVS